MNPVDGNKGKDAELPGISSESFAALQRSMPGVLDKLFTRNIFLMKMNVEGCHNISHIETLINEIELGAKLALVREPENSHDKRAISVRNGDRKLGYIPRAQNGILSRLMDAGKYLYAMADDKLTDASVPDFEDEALTVSIYMQD